MKPQSKKQSNNQNVKRVTGQLIDELGEPMIGVTVMIKGTTTGAVTDLDGKFSIDDVPAGASELHISYIGYEAKDVQISSSAMQIKMSPDNELLDEVVVVGYGTVKKDDLTGSVSAIKPDEFNRGAKSSAQDALVGKVAGVNVVSSSGAFSLMAPYLLPRHVMPISVRCQSRILVSTPRYLTSNGNLALRVMVLPLASDYRHIFLADNDECKEIIWPLVQDGLKAQSSGGTNFYVKAFVNGPMNELYNTGIGSRGWGNVRAKTTLVDAFDADDVMFDVNDPWGNNKKDKRAQFMTALPNQVKETWDSKDAMTSTYTCGYGYIKWRNVTKDDQIPASGDAYTSIDFPLFRTGEAYLTAAEAILRGAKGSKAEALKYVNEIRERAYMSGKYAKEGVRSDVSGDIEESELTLDFLMAERQRELASELVRRTDLIRFGKYTKGYNWDWKNGERLGTDVDDHYQLFPIPQTEFSNNPQLKQNAGYAN